MWWLMSWTTGSVGGTKGWWFGQVDKGEGGRRDWDRSWAFGLRFDVRVGKKPSHGRPKNKWAQDRRKVVATHCQRLPFAGIVTGTGHWWASTQQVS